MSNQLLPCPFCGHDEPTHDEGDQSAWVQCTNFECGMCGPIASGPSLAAAAWNRRATQPAAGEPKPIGYISETVRQELLNGKHVPANICTATPSRRNPHPGPDANWSVPIFVAPPAAAHGDEAVAIVSRYFIDPWYDQSGAGGGWRHEVKLLTDLPDGTKLYAMRAQGDGGSGDA